MDAATETSLRLANVRVPHIQATRNQRAVAISIHIFMVFTSLRESPYSDFSASLIHLSCPRYSNEIFTVLCNTVIL